MNMKKRIFSSIILAIGMCTMLSGQNVKHDEAALVYYMPQTQLDITIHYTKVTVEPGPFYLYAERYLGVKDVAVEASTRYEMTDITLNTSAIADTTRSYKIVATSGSEAQWITLTEDGLLYGYNVQSPYPDEKPQQEYDAILYSDNTPYLMPLMEEQMVASSIAKMAEGAAKQIYHIRETRINLLAGDVEHTPADGKAMQLVLDELNKREQMLAELFIGTRSVEHYTHTITYTPNDDAKNHIIARFSQYAGIVDADDLSGEPIKLTLTGKRQTYIHSIEESNKKDKATIPSQLYYNLPGSAQVVVAFGDKCHASANITIAQYGIAVPIAKSLLLNKNTPHIYFNTQTGNILSIEQ